MSKHEPTIVSIAEVKVSQDVVNILIDFLDMARKGEITAIALATTTPTKEVYVGRAGEQGLSLVGGLEMIKRNVLDGL